MHTLDIITWILKGIVALLAIMSGAYKLTGADKIIVALEKLGIAAYKNYLGLAEIIFGLLFLYPPTSNIGFLLLICYFSGALAVDISHKNLFIAPLVILVLIFVAGYLSSPSLFL